MRKIKKQLVHLLGLILFCVPHLAHVVSISIPVFNENNFDMTDHPVIFGTVPIPQGVIVSSIVVNYYQH